MGRCFSVNRILALILAIVISAISGYKQESFLYEGFSSANSNGFIFRHSVPNASAYPLDSVVRICSVGLWAWYGQVNYQDLVLFTESTTLQCINQTMEAIQSFRRIGPAEVTSSLLNLTLYAGHGFTGLELDIQGTAYAGIPFPVKSLVYTGYQSDRRWEVYEGTNFNGRSVCLPSPEYNSYIRAYVNASSSGLEQIGSVIRGCNRRKHIELQ